MSYYSQTGKGDSMNEENNSSVSKKQRNYVFSDTPVTFVSPIVEETISKEDEVKFYEKVFQTKRV